ncbi:MAG: hypothetical protein H6Q43_3107, partial [Deltaproteobacteria bacterium]|nr:hypothetical protein [Deltaproteobacteria bacterium]
MAGIWDSKSQVPEKKAKELLKGAVDFHIHTGPDIYPRLVNDIEVARQAKKAGMRAVLIKSHATITADRAQMSRFVTGFSVFGGVALNWHVGGLNKYAVECAAKSEVGPILRVIAQNNMILATGHLSPVEGIKLIREAKNAGVEKVVVTHPAASFVNYSAEQMREALNAGATFLEHVFNDCTPQVADPL